MTDEATTRVVNAYRSEHQRDIVNRLRRIEGQVRALVEMVESGRPCEDVASKCRPHEKPWTKPSTA